MKKFFRTIIVLSIVFLIIPKTVVYAKNINKSTVNSESERGLHTAYISGYPDGSVKPEANITRQEAAAVIYRLLVVNDEYEAVSNNFSDVGADSWSNIAISTLSSIGIISGYEDGTFKPESEITRAEVATIVSKLTSDKDSSMSFNDIDGHWAEEFILKASGAGWVAGYTDGSFKPDDYITRAEMIFLINVIFNRMPEDGTDLLSGMKTWSDNADETKWYYLAIQEASNTHEYVIKNNGHERWNLVKN